jgi:hypothetical protein
MLSPVVTAYDSPYLSKKNLGTGNVLFQIASVYGLAKRFNRGCDFTKVMDYCQKIETLFGDKHGHTLYRNCYSIPTVYSESVQETVLKNQCPLILSEVLNNPSPLIVIAHLEDPRYFDDYREDIFAMFKPDAMSQRQIDTQYPELKTRNVVGVHFRLEYEAMFSASKSYYTKAIQYMKENVENPLFFIFSDGEPDMSEFDIEYKMVQNNPDYIDLWTMSQCKHMIIGGSTFSWWGMYLNQTPNKIVTYPRSVLRMIQHANGRKEHDLHANYFLGGVQIDDTQ